MKRLLGYVRPYWHRYALATLCTLATVTLGMVLPYLTGKAIDATQARDSSRLGPLAGEIFMAALAMGAVRWCSRFIIFNCGRDIEYDLRNDLFTRLTLLDRSFYERLKTGDLMSRMINDLSAVRMMVGMGVLTFTNTPVTYIYALIFMVALQCAADDRNPAAVCCSVRLDSAADALTDGAQPARAGGTGRNRREGAGEPFGHPCREGLHARGARGRRASARRNDGYNEQGLALARSRGALMPLIRGTSRAR